MNIFREKINKENLHHAYIVIGSIDLLRNDLNNFIVGDLNIKIIKNPDILYFEYNTLGVDDTKDLIEIQNMHSFYDNKEDEIKNKKIFVISLNMITNEAQNALLKVFEEPTPNTHFFILAPQNIFLPTFLSRVHIFTDNIKNEGVLLEDKNIGEHMSEVSKLALDISDDKKVKQDAIIFVKKIEMRFVSDPIKYYKELKLCEDTRKAILSQGAMIKMLLENLILQIY